jgi:hypothetical protein
MTYFSIKYNLELNLEEIDKLFYEYLIMCRKNQQIPEFNHTEFSSLNKDKIDKDFIDLLIYYSKVKKYTK